ncbi:MAG: RhuM family protein [Bacteroides sp.]|nr:RhuM family protein [Bacteroides sp.]
MENKGEIILYQPDETVKLEVRLEEETVWLTQAQIVELFQSSKANISEHIRNIYEQEELEEDSTVRDFRTVRQEGNRKVVRNLTYYNLDAIISIGFRVNSKRGIQFRRWANSVLKEYMLKGYSVNQRLSNLEHRIDDKLIEHEQRLNRIDEKIDFFVRTSLPPVEGIFYDGQIFDAYKFATDLIRTARTSILLIDNYVDESVLLMLSKRNDGVKADIYTHSISQQLRLDLERHNRQYSPINIHAYTRSHDRFLIIDGTEVYHIGASLKDLGKKMFAFSKLDIPASAITDLL